MTTVVCENNNINLGTIKENSTVTASYTLTNTGMEDLYITNISTSCGCTASDWSRTAVKPHDNTIVKLNFNSAGRMGSTSKSASVEGNFTHGLTLLFTVNVEK